MLPWEFCKVSGRDSCKVFSSHLGHWIPQTMPLPLSLPPSSWPSPCPSASVTHLGRPPASGHLELILAELCL